MTLTIGQTIKKLRKERLLTQEELAEQINVTSQAVSKWENESGMPDISQIVPLSSVFGISTDVLFGLEDSSEIEKVKKILEEARNTSEKEFDDTKKFEVQYKILLDSLKSYPNNTLLLSDCLRTGACIALSKNDDVILKECIREANIIISYSKNLREILESHWWLVRLYSKFKQFDKAKEHANCFPYSVDSNLDSAFAWIYRDEEKVEDEMKMISRNIYSYLNSLLHNIHLVGRVYQKQEKHEEAIESYLNLFNIIDLVYSDDKGTSPYIGAGLQWEHGNLASSYLEIGDNENAFVWIEKMIDYHIIVAKRMNKEMNIQTPILKNIDINFNDVDYYPKEMIMSNLNQSKFDSIRDTKRFIKLINKVNCIE